ncbi:hypothetical protein LEP1GSC038_3886 [Leptospira weilii str. 2006001855]|uniref:Uncharacterized protein n=1 Tax=Leptospira weilii str. 2006001855 TaxID=996804 RepID=M6FHD9_9LEPT|nr:hypothetical protein LEP1GSC038_3886 [Leptospira weilii str. 2006001855]
MNFINFHRYVFSLDCESVHPKFFPKEFFSPLYFPFVLRESNFKTSFPKTHFCF